MPVNKTGQWAEAGAASTLPAHAEAAGGAQGGLRRQCLSQCLGQCRFTPSVCKLSRGPRPRIHASFSLRFPTIRTVAVASRGLSGRLLRTLHSGAREDGVCRAASWQPSQASSPHARPCSAISPEVVQLLRERAASLTLGGGWCLVLSSQQQAWQCQLWEPVK